MSVPFGESSQQRRVECHSSGGIDHIEPILLVNGLPPHDGPAAAALLEKIVEPADAGDVNRYAVERSALVNRHPRLRDCALADDVARRPAEDVHDVDAALERVAAGGDEIAGGT